MGNCGVGFAPAPPDAVADLIDLMEGVEDIPGTALYEGMPWGEWESFPEYLAFLDRRRWTLDVGCPARPRRAALLRDGRARPALQKDCTAPNSRCGS